MQESYPSSSRDHQAGRIVLFAIGLILLFTIVALALFNSDFASWKNKYMAGASPAPTETAVACTMDAKLCPDGSSVGRTGPNCEFAPCPGESDGTSAIEIPGQEKYTDPQGVYRFSYPPTFTLDTNDPLHARLLTLGPTQKGQTEIYDGILITFEVVALNGQSIEEWVDAQIANNPNDGTVEVISPKTEVTLNQNFGYTYTSRSLGTVQNYVIRKDPNSDVAVHISTLISDPTDQGFATEMTKVFATLELLK